MSLKRDEVLIDHLISLQIGCERAMRITVDTTPEAVASSELLQLAVAMAVAQIGEISGRLLKKWPEFCEEHPELELVRANAMRHRLIHGYDQLDIATLWATTQVSVPAMLKAADRLLSEYGIHAP